jgi:hypothetical protein
MRPAKYGASPALFRRVGNYNEAGVQDNAGVYVDLARDIIDEAVNAR